MWIDTPRWNSISGRSRLDPSVPLIFYKIKTRKAIHHFHIVEIVRGYTLPVPIWSLGRVTINELQLRSNLFRDHSSRELSLHIKPSRSVCCMERDRHRAYPPLHVRYPLRFPYRSMRQHRARSSFIPYWSMWGVASIPIWVVRNGRLINPIPVEQPLSRNITLPKRKMIPYIHPNDTVTFCTISKYRLETMMSYYILRRTFLTLPVNACLPLKWMIRLHLRMLIF